LRPVLRFRAARARLDIEKRAARVHLAGKHPHQLELPDALLEPAGVAVHLGEAGFVAFALDEFQEFRGLDQAAPDLVQFADGAREPRALAAEFLGPLRLVPDLCVAELAIEFLEPLTLAVVLKGTPSARQGAA
jgi:hypothetical protein